MIEKIKVVYAKYRLVFHAMGVVLMMVLYHFIFNRKTVALQAPMVYDNTKLIDSLDAVWNERVEKMLKQSLTIDSIALDRMAKQALARQAEIEREVIENYLRNKLRNKIEK